MRAPQISVKVVFERVGRAYRIHTVVKNISVASVVLEEVSAFVLSGFARRDDTDNLKFTRFDQSHHCECQPKTVTFFDEGFSLSVKMDKNVSHSPTLVVGRAKNRFRRALSTSER